MRCFQLWARLQLFLNGIERRSFSREFWGANSMKPNAGAPSIKGTGGSGDVRKLKCREMQKTLDFVYGGSQMLQGVYDGSQPLGLPIPTTLTSPRGSGAIISPRDSSSPRDRQVFPAPTRIIHKSPSSSCVPAFDLLELLKSQATQPDSATGSVESERQLCSLLYTFPFFQHFEEAHVIAMAKLCDCVRILKGNVLFVQGDADVDSVFFIVQGSLSIHFHESASNEQMLAKRDDWAEQIPDKDVGSNSFNILEGLDPEQYFGKEIAVEGVGSTLGENALWDRRRQQCSPMGTAIASSHTVCALKLSRETLEKNRLMLPVFSRSPHVLHHPEYRWLEKQFSKTDPALRTAEQLNVARQIFYETPLFMNFHGCESGSRKAIDMLLRHIVIEPELTQTEVLWFEGNSADDRRFLLHILLKGNVKTYKKGTGVDPLQLSSIHWDDTASIARVIGNESAPIATFGCIVGGPAESSQSSPEETIVGLKGCVFATINKHIWKEILKLVPRRLLFKVQELRYALFPRSDEHEDHGTPLLKHSFTPFLRLGSGGNISASSSASDLTNLPFLSSASFLRRKFREQWRNEVELDQFQFQRASMLRDSFSFFSQVPWKRLLQLSSGFRLLRVPKYEALCFEGSACEGVFVVLAGVAHVYSQSYSDLCRQLKQSHMHPPNSASPSRNLMTTSNPSQKFYMGSLTLHRKACGMDPSAEVQMLGTRCSELHIGGVIFETEAAQSLPYSASLVAGESSFDVIYIETATYLQLASPFPVCTPPDWICSGISLEHVAPCDRTAEQQERIAQSIQQVAGLEHVDLKVLRGVAKHVKLQRFESESLLFDHAKKADTIYVLLEGTVSIHGEPQSERRKGNGYAGCLSELGVCVRIGVGGEEPFGLTSMILCCHNWSTVACRSSCLFYTLSQTSMDLELYQTFESACSKIIQCQEYMYLSRDDRKDHCILQIVNYLRENPFFRGLTVAAHHRLAININLLRMSAREFLHTDASVHQVAVVNKGSVSTPAAASQTETINSIRIDSWRPDKSRGGVKFSAGTLEGLDMGTGGAQAAVNLFTRRPSMSFSRRSSSRFVTKGWNSLIGSLDQLSRAPSNCACDTPVASYGQAFWTGVVQCFADKDNTEVFLVSKAEWAKIQAQQNNMEQTKVEAFVAAHPCFEGLKPSDLQNILQNTKLVCLDERAVLFKRGSNMSDLCFLMHGCMELRTEICLERNVLSAGSSQVIPSISVATLSVGAIINDVTDLNIITPQTPLQVFQNWSSVAETYTAVALSNCSVIAVNKSAIVMFLSPERRTQMFLAKQVVESFHHDRKSQLIQARDGMVHGRTILPYHQHHPSPDPEVDLFAALKLLAHHQPPVFKPAFAKNLKSPRKDCVETAKVDYISALLSPRFHGALNLPPLHHRGRRGGDNVRESGRDGQEGAKTDSHMLVVHADAPTIHKQTHSSAHKHTVVRGMPSLGMHEIATLQDVKDSLFLCSHTQGDTPRQMYLRNGRPGNMGLCRITRSKQGREEKKRELRDEERTKVQTVNGRQPEQDKDDVVMGFSVDSKQYDTKEVLRLPGAKNLPPMFPQLFLSD